MHLHVLLWVLFFYSFFLVGFYAIRLPAFRFFYALFVFVVCVIFFIILFIILFLLFRFQDSVSGVCDYDESLPSGQLKESHWNSEEKQLQVEDQSFR